MKTVSSVAIALAAMLLASCTTTTEAPGTKADLKEAARLNTQLGIDYMRKGQYDLALEKLQRAIEQDDDFATAHSTIALLYQRKGEAELAEKHYREALDLNQGDPGTLNNFGIFLCGQGEVEDAEELFLKAAQNKENTSPADAWANAGVCVRRDPKRAARAEDYYREALKLNPRHPNALAQMALASYEKQDYLRSRAFLQRYESAARPTPQTLWIGVQTERKLGDLQSARGYERRLKTEFPDAPETYELLKQSGQARR
ncbi:MAG TPA: type IV pilus biogenesis/stability protein PilW [Verrucomicrobiae bacterium]|nr:type IV pilus biogenesis/stability protein PilW [Verrucomicrobiae bacterium]